jgi:hypothetical protein
MPQSPESASTPISMGGWRYNPDDAQDVIDFADHGADELAGLERNRGYDFTDHPTRQSATPDTEEPPMTQLTVGQMIRRHSSPLESTPPPVALPVVWLSHRRWDLGPNEGIVSAAWRVQVVDTPTPLATPDGRWLDVRHVEARRDIVTAQVAEWLAEPWPQPYSAPPRWQPQTEVTDPGVSAALDAAQARYGA